MAKIFPRANRIKLTEPNEITPAQRTRYETESSVRNKLARLLSIAETIAPKLADQW